MDRQKLTRFKLDKAKKDKQLAKERHEAQLDAIASVDESINKLYELLNDKQEYDFDKLHAQLETIDRHLDLKPILQPLFSSLEESIKNKEATRQQHLPRTIDVKDFSKLLEAVKSNKPLPVKIDLSELKKAIVEVQQRIEEQTTKEPGQTPEKYLPVRRVVKIGNRFIFDDNLNTGGRGGGGSTTSSGVVATEVEISNDSGNPIPISGSVTGSITADTELPTAAALADNTANPTTTSVGTFGLLFDGSTWDRARSVAALGDGGTASAAVGIYGYNGSTWDRLRSDTTNGLDVDVTRFPAGPSTSVVTSVNDSATNVTLKVSNASRREIIIQNDSSSTLYVKLGTTATTTDYSVKLYTDDVFRTSYTGNIDGIWSADSTGAALVTELT